MSDTSIEIPAAVLQYTPRVMIKTEQDRRTKIFARSLKNPILKLRLKCFARGPRGLMMLVRTCRLLSKGPRINLPTFRRALRKLGYKPYKDQDIAKLFRAIDENKDGFITLAELQRKLRPSICDCRMDTIEIAYTKVADMDGLVRADIFENLIEYKLNAKYLRKKYKWSPLELEDIWLRMEKGQNVESEESAGKTEADGKTNGGIKTKTEVKTVSNVKAKTDITAEAENAAEQIDERLTKDDFINYYALVSATVERDNYFQKVLKHNYKL